jgi:hypothetical protein
LKNIRYKNSYFFNLNKKNIFFLFLFLLFLNKNLFKEIKKQKKQKKNKKKRNMNQNTSLLFYTNNKDYTKLDPKESKDINIIVGKRSKQDVIKRVAVEFNTFLSALFYSPQILQTLNKQKYIMEKQKELFEPCFQKEIVQELNNLHVLFEESLLEYKKTNEDPERQKKQYYWICLRKKI